MYVLATHNPGKVEEFNNLFKEYGVTFTGLHELGIPDIPETGTTYEENARIKAKAVSEITGAIVVADDSGIEIEALGNKPGVFSARYSDDIPAIGDESRDQKNIRKTIDQFKKLGIHSSPAKYVSCLVAMKPNGEELVVYGFWDGTIIDTPKGTSGFGYDPIFLAPETGKTSSEMTLEEKKSLTHRSKALKELMEKWNDFITK